MRIAIDRLRRSIASSHAADTPQIASRHAAKLSKSRAKPRVVARKEERVQGRRSVAEVKAVSEVVAVMKAVVEAMEV
jgi:hypothetical protein